MGVGIRMDVGTGVCVGVETDVGTGVGVGGTDVGTRVGVEMIDDVLKVGDGIADDSNGSVTKDSEAEVVAVDDDRLGGISSELVVVKVKMTLTEVGSPADLVEDSAL